jgi:hypothetical protein
MSDRTLTPIRDSYWLIEQGLACEDAFKRIVELRMETPDGWKESPQTEAQRSFVRTWRRR